MLRQDTWSDVLRLSSYAVAINIRRQAKDVKGKLIIIINAIAKAKIQPQNNRKTIANFCDCFLIAFQSRHRRGLGVAAGGFVITKISVDLRPHLQ
ncbi:hypothetical protein [Pseudoramibacter porci]|uniref:Uncharacterized protein n=1 Tax=Pseudoramibacter porci TaxID=2606631 RepID=A0A7X2NGH0_9FIRM|nr:hypothetical protein [Pseudoramibacter porci]MSS20206.1 hypothetical protein [Pseudoramibacter porci]